ncbi:hypothetical protein SAMN04487906_1471 [Zhouia amylolytica]|uniref:Uncharacterized protein n=1 Tax=Zhouia amylolytica TaxID=376730 RepID=A0A1I6S8K4_9FLAO|nr:hypothetical protein SAMN04487906_1471 [Zhouia amylolytica]
MGNIWIIAIPLFLIITFLFWRFTHTYFKNEVYGEKMWKKFGSKAIYWQGTLFVSGGITSLILYLLKVNAILTF